MDSWLTYVFGAMSDSDLFDDGEDRSQSDATPAQPPKQVGDGETPNNKKKAIGNTPATPGTESPPLQAPSVESATATSTLLTIATNVAAAMAINKSPNVCAESETGGIDSNTIPVKSLGEDRIKAFEEFLQRAISEHEQHEKTKTVIRANISQSIVLRTQHEGNAAVVQAKLQSCRESQDATKRELGRLIMHLRAQRRLLDRKLKGLEDERKRHQDNAAKEMKKMQLLEKNLAVEESKMFYHKDVDSLWKRWMETDSIQVEDADTEVNVTTLRETTETRMKEDDGLQR